MNKGVITKVLDTISGIFFAIVPALTGAEMLKAVMTLAVAYLCLSSKSDTYKFINYIGASTFYFLPILLASSATKKFKCNEYAAMAIGGVLLHPTFTDIPLFIVENGFGSIDKVEDDDSIKDDQRISILKL